MSDRPVLLGGKPLFRSHPRLVKPWVPPLSDMSAAMEASLRSGMLTNADNVRAFEEAIAQRIEVENAVAVSNCTSGLLLVIRCLGIEGRVLVPAYTFCATVHAVDWNHLPITFLDADPGTFCIDPDHVTRKLDDDVGLIMGTHVFGCPCDVERLEKISRSTGIPLLYDAAHALGSRAQDRPLGGFGKAEVFSLTPTKVVVAGEGGVVATQDGDLAKELRIARNYGDSGDYDCAFVGLNARLPEWNAILAQHTLNLLPAQLERRQRIAETYREALGSIPGISFQRIPDNCVSAHKDFTVMIDSLAFGLDRDQIAIALQGEGVPVKKYFSPPIHRMKCYEWLESPELPVAEQLSARALSIPIHALLELETVRLIARAVERIHGHADAVREKLEG